MNLGWRRANRDQRFDFIGGGIVQGRHELHVLWNHNTLLTGQWKKTLWAFQIATKLRTFTFTRLTTAGAATKCRCMCIIGTSAAVTDQHNHRCEVALEAHGM